MKLRLWELILACLGALTGGIYVWAGRVFIGILWIALASFFCLSRAVVIDDHRPGGYALRRGQIEAAQAIVVFSVAAAAIATSLAASWAGWSHDLRGEVAIYALVGLELFALAELQRRGSIALDHLPPGPQTT